MQFVSDRNTFRISIYAALAWIKINTCGDNEFAFRVPNLWFEYLKYVPYEKETFTLMYFVIDLNWRPKCELQIFIPSKKKSMINNKQSRVLVICGYTFLASCYIHSTVLQSTNPHILVSRYLAIEAISCGFFPICYSIRKLFVFVHIQE